LRKVGKMIKEAFGDENVEVIVEECDCDLSQRALDNIEIGLELKRLVLNARNLLKSSVAAILSSRSMILIGY